MVVEQSIALGDLIAAPPKLVEISQAAERVLDRAAREAHAHAHIHISTVHLLLSLVGEGEGIVQQALVSSGLAGPRAINQLLARIQDNKEDWLELPDEVAKLYSQLTTKARRVLHLAHNAAKQRRVMRTTTLDLLRVLAQDGLEIGITAFSKVGVLPEKLNCSAQDYSREKSYSPAPELTQEVWQVLLNARKLAAESAEAFVFPEHLAVALTIADRSAALTRLRELGVDLNRLRIELEQARSGVRARIERLTAQTAKPPDANPWPNFTRQARRVMDYAQQAAWITRTTSSIPTTC